MNRKFTLLFVNLLFCCSVAFAQEAQKSDLQKSSMNMICFRKLWTN